MSGLRLALACAGDDGFRLELDCELPAAGVTAVYGPSGSGKSTLLECVAGLRRPERGSEIHFGASPWLTPERCLPPWQRRIGFVFQDARLFPHLSVADNLDYGARRRGGALSRERVLEWLRLGPLLQRRPETLSAGQRQRVAIGRALLSGPELLLLDEPLANLDHAARRDCLDCLQTAQRELGLPMLYVSHDIEELSQLADYLLVLEQGRAVDRGPLLELCGRLDTRLSREQNAAAILLGRISRHDRDYGLTELEVEGQPVLVNHLPGAPGQRRRLRIPARDVSVCRERPAASSILNILPVELAEIEQSGEARLMLRLALGGQYLLARVTRRSVEQLALRPGDRLFAQIKSAALLSETLDD